MSYMKKIAVKSSKEVESDTLVLMIHSKPEIEPVPTHLIYGYMNANVYYKREKKFNTKLAVLNRKYDQIIYPYDVLEVLKEYKGNYKNVKILTFVSDIYNAVLKSEGCLNLLDTNVSFEYIGISSYSDHELSLPSTVFFLYEKGMKVVKEFCDRSFHVYGCEGYRNEKEELVPYMNDYARCEAPKNDFKYTFMSGFWTYSLDNDEGSTAMEEDKLNTIWKMQELKHLNPIKWNGDKVGVIK